MGMLKASRFYKDWNLAYGGCSCHNSKRDHRKFKKSAKNAEKKLWKKEAND